MTFNAQEIAHAQARLTAYWHEVPPATSADGFALLIQENHLRNFQLWHEEDIARRDDIGSERIHQAKRAIDRFNQERNNFIEEMDKALVAALSPAESGCPKNSETPGMIIDRLSIMALKEFHMREEAQRGDASPEHRAACSAKLARISHQRNDLTQSLAELLECVTNRTRTFAVYYQFKMYNDPALNPQLYGGKT
ncbi:MAG: DUF4254 domain-containing protein [Gloeobacteraceae cyanobacterium ES-bin-144]|nr:DUF4254 domain-containing protein [Verrucomicrobiales bacterium]